MHLTKKYGNKYQKKMTENLSEKLPRNKKMLNNIQIHC